MNPSNDPNLRRRTREILCDEATMDILKSTGISQGWQCWEAGAGLGSIANWLQQKVGPLGGVWATDVRSECLIKMKNLFRSGFTIEKHDLQLDPFPIDAFDLIHCRFVLEHLSQRNIILDKFAKALKPQGLAVIECAHFDECAVGGTTAYLSIMEAIQLKLRKTGTDFKWSAVLPKTMCASGFCDVRALGKLRFFQGDSFEAEFWASNIIQANLPEDLQPVLRKCLHDLSDDANWFCGPAIIVATGKRCLKD